jgi:hypothetical protein
VKSIGRSSLFSTYQDRWRNCPPAAGIDANHKTCEVLAAALTFAALQTIVSYNCLNCNTLGALLSFRVGPQG